VRGLGQLAVQGLAQEKPCQALDTTALVHEAYISSQRHFQSTQMAGCQQLTTGLVIWAHQYLNL
jgi:hypothetical protein